MFTKNPWVRTAEQAVENMFRSANQPPPSGQVPPRPENKRVWASLLKGNAVEVPRRCDAVIRRASRRGWRIAGERALQILVEGTLGVTLVLVLLHVLERLWKSAHVFHAEGSLEVELPGSGPRTLRILFGEVSQVVKGIRQSVTKRRMFGAKRKTLRGVANYLYRNRLRMRYDEYLAKGRPIASGPVEGACKILLKDRMERSGMRWTEPSPRPSSSSELFT